MPAIQAFSGASNFVINNPTLYYQGLGGRNDSSGLNILLHASVPDATHDSRVQERFARSLPRTEHEEIVDALAVQLATKLDDSNIHAIWLKGPKSNLGHLCAQKLGNQGLLAASFFFSNNGQDEAAHLFPTISFQLATMFPAYKAALEEKLLLDPTLLSKCLEVQFCELIVKPLQQLAAYNFPEITGSRKFIVIGGFDNCGEPEDRFQIIRGITTSRNLPFRWVIHSKPDSKSEKCFLACDMLETSTWNPQFTVQESATLDDLNLEDTEAVVAIVQLGGVKKQNRIYILVGVCCVFD